MALYLSGVPEADALLEHDGFALLVGMVLDQQVPLERAFLSPYELRQRLGGTLDARAVVAMDPEVLRAAFSEKPALHRFPGSMADRVQQMARMVVDRFEGDAERVWSDSTDGADLLRRVRSLPGFGEQKAKIFVALLGKRLDVRPPGWEQAAGHFAEPGSFLSIADIDSPEALARVRDHKREIKAAMKGLARLEDAGNASPRSAKVAKAAPKASAGRRVAPKAIAKAATKTTATKTTARTAAKAKPKGN